MIKLSSQQETPTVVVEIIETTIVIKTFKLTWEILVITFFISLPLIITFFILPL